MYDTKLGLVKVKALNKTVSSRKRHIKTKETLSQKHVNFSYTLDVVKVH